MIQQAVIDGQTQEIIKPEVTMNWGSWVQTVVDFLIVAFCIFIAIKGINQLKRKQEEAPAPAPKLVEFTQEPGEDSSEPPVTTTNTEIRDLLKEKK